MKKYIYRPFTRWVVALLIFAGFLTINAQNQVTKIYTDYNAVTKHYDAPGTGGLWNSQTYTADADRPRNQHHLLAFTWKGTTFSTGIDDAKLTSNGVVFNSEKFQALPVSNFVPSGTSVYLQLGEYWDGVSGGITGPYNTNVIPSPFSAPQGVGAVLTHGLQGLDLGSAITNIPATTPLTFNFGGVLSSSVIGDGIPDILVTQTAQPSSTLDQIWFEDGNGNQVGSKISINFSSVPHLGKWFADFYVPSTGYVTGSTWVNSSREIRILGFEASDFGLTSANYTSAHVLKYHLKGTSDVAFIAFNTNFITLTIANGDKGITPINTPVTLDILANDNPDNQSDLTSFTVPATTTNGGTVVKNADGTITYTPASGFTGTDTFTYEICKGTSCAMAIVTILVYPNAYEECLNEDITLSVPVYAGNYTYQWTLPDNSTVSGTASAETISLSLTNISASDSGTYTLTTVNTGTSETATYQITLTVKNCACTKTGAAGTPDGYTKVGILTKGSITNSTGTVKWPENVPDGYIVMDSENKGFVITHMTTAQRNLLTPVKGMMIYNTDLGCVQIYRGTKTGTDVPKIDASRYGWNCIKKSCNE
ncbi:MAG: Ig-like domain-containing protein [Bergeyella sp.]